ncbi:MAG TPA: hypothetical protein VK923_15240 [Euzebyales bacterium]|nr:hypothetical protein [Euzebyales bacterium]
MLLVALLVAAGVVAAWTARAPGTLQIGDTRATPTAGDTAWAPPRPGLWVPLPAAPVLSRIDQAITGRGDRVVVWGGFDARGRPLHDGAVLDVGSGDWTRLPTAGAGGTSAEAVWVGDDVVIVSRTATRTYDAVRRIWRDGPPPPLGDAEVLEHVVAMGDLVIAHTRPAVDGSRMRPGALVWSRDTRRWRRLPDPQAGPADGGVVLATATRLVTLRPASPQAHVIAAELDPSAPDAAWAAVAPPPAADRPLDRLLGAVVDDRIVLVGADQAGDAVHAVVRDLQDTWRPIPLPPVAVTTDDDLLAVGRGAVLWDRRAGAGVVLDIAAGRWDRIPTSPAADRVPRPAVAAGPHLVTWGGLGPVGAVLRVP